MCRVKNSGKVHTAADTIDRPVLFVAHVRYGLSSNRAKLLVVLKWSVSIVKNISSFGSHLWNIYAPPALKQGFSLPGISPAVGPLPPLFAFVLLLWTTLPWLGTVLLPSPFSPGHQSCGPGADEGGHVGLWWSTILSPDILACL